LQFQECQFHARVRPARENRLPQRVERLRPSWVAGTVGKQDQRVIGSIWHRPIIAAH